MRQNARLIRHVVVFTCLVLLQFTGDSRAAGANGSSPAELPAEPIPYDPRQEPRMLEVERLGVMGRKAFVVPLRTVRLPDGRWKHVLYTNPGGHFGRDQLCLVTVDLSDGSVRVHGPLP